MKANLDLLWSEDSQLQIASSTNELLIRALRDIQLGWNMPRDWPAHALKSIWVSYRLSVIGPFWIFLQQIAFVTGISLPS